MPLRLTAVFIATLLAFVMARAPVYGEQLRLASEGGIDERLGEFIPVDLSFLDDQGRPVLLRELVTKPTVLVLVYYSCTHTCPVLLSGVSEVLSRIELAPGKDFNVVTVSFDENDTPAIAGQKKKDYIKASGRDFPEGSWNFLTGNEEQIRRLTGAAGFGFKRTANGFDHPVGLIVLSPQGKITRYLYGVTFLPMDLTLAVTEASKGLAVPTVRKLLLYCYSYDPAGRRYVFNILRITAVATLFFIILFISWLTLSGRKEKPAK